MIPFIPILIFVEGLTTNRQPLAVSVVSSMGMLIYKSTQERVLLPILIVTIDPPKRHWQYIVDDEAVRSNKKLLTNIPIEDTTETGEVDSLSLESLYKNKSPEILGMGHCNATLFSPIQRFAWRVAPTASQVDTTRGLRGKSFRTFSQVMHETTPLILQRYNT